MKENGAWGVRDSFISPILSVGLYHPFLSGCLHGLQSLKSLFLRVRRIFRLRLFRSGQKGERRNLIVRLVLGFCFLDGVGLCLRRRGLQGGFCCWWW